MYQATVLGEPAPVLEWPLRSEWGPELELPPELAWVLASEWAWASDQMGPVCRLE